MQLTAKISTQSVPSYPIPEKLNGLSRLAHNFYWSWHSEVAGLFARINPRLWSEGAGPVRVLKETRDYSALLADSAFMSSYEKALKAFDAYIEDSKTTWYATKGDPEKRLAGKAIAYFCAEFGLTETFNIYSGGLGILAGDHCKEASDMGLPFVGIGLFYRRGFFQQMVDTDGRQEHNYPVIDPECQPIQRILDPKTKAPLLVEVDFPGRKVKVAAWLAPVGRIPLVLLDTDIPENAREDRAMTNQLYVSGRDMRLHQEMILGVGGVRVLRAIGIDPTVWHMNEGHSAFLLVERMRELSLAGKSVDEITNSISSSSVFTIHTPVPAGNERFWHEHAASLLKSILEGSKVTVEQVLLLARGVDKDPKYFDMTAMGLRLANGRNGVSLLHGHTADDTWRKVTHSEIIGVTNGVHMPTWLGEKMREVFAKSGGTFDKATDLEISRTGQGGRGRWEPASKIDAKALWQAHNDQKRALIEFARKRICEQHLRHGKGPGELKGDLAALNPEAFTIGFARRFATYKRASLMFSDEKRFLKILENKNRPVQVVFAGKAHPADREGQKLIAKVYEKTQSERFKGKVFFIEEYNMEVGRALVQGVDMWLNNPRRPLEASGTSGMKAAANGVPNMSILDGWWDEACDGRSGFENGFAIGGRSIPSKESVQDKNDAIDFYHVLESQILPLYFNRNADGVPEGWIRVMQNSIASCVYDFSTLRMLEDYMSKLYLPAAK
jgi:starch phosphorylase